MWTLPRTIQCQRALALRNPEDVFDQFDPFLSGFLLFKFAFGSTKKKKEVDTSRALKPTTKTVQALKD